MIAVEIPTGFNTRSKKGHGNKHSFQCWTCSVGYFWSWWNNKFNHWQKLPWKQPEESQCGCQGGRVKGRKRHAKNATESAQVEKPGNWKTGRAVISLVLGLFCFYNGCYLVLSDSNARILVDPFHHWMAVSKLSLKPLAPKPPHLTMFVLPATDGRVKWTCLWKQCQYW